MKYIIWLISKFITAIVYAVIAIIALLMVVVAASFIYDTLNNLFYGG